MRIPKQAWSSYVNKLSKIDHTAAVVMQRWIDANSGASLENIVSTAYLLVGKYGEAAAALACEMYDGIAAAQRKVIQPAAPAEPPGEKYVKSAVTGTIQDKGIGSIPDLVSRMVKQTGADTTLKNAKRDGAYFAWIPSGDSCAFCLTLASRGWQKASEKTIKGDHAEHIHNHCNCEFAISFDGPGEVEGYDPDKYRDMYDNAEGATPQERINYMRRQQYAVNKEYINEQKKRAYRMRNNLPIYNGFGMDITKIYLKDAEPCRGNIDCEDGFDRKMRPDEYNMGKWIHDTLGGNILLKAETNRYKTKNPDYEWMGEFWDLKTLSTEKAANSAIKKGMKQIGSNPGGIIIDYRNHNIDYQKLFIVIDKRMSWYPKDCADIMIVQNGKLVKVIRY